MQDNFNNNSSVDSLGISGSESKSPLEQSFPSSGKPADKPAPTANGPKDKNVSESQGKLDVSQDSNQSPTSAAPAPSPHLEKPSVSGGTDLPQGVSNTNSPNPAPASKPEPTQPLPPKGPQSEGGIKPLNPNTGSGGNTNPLKELPKNDPAPTMDSSKETSSETPDTDQFLKSILDDDSGPKSSTGDQPKIQNSVDLTKPNPGLADKPEMNVKIDPPKKEPAAPVPEPPKISNKPPIDDHYEPEDKSGSGLDSIKKPVDNVNKKDDMMEATAVKGNKKRKSPLKVILAIILSLVVVGIGYYAYVVLFGNSGPDDGYDTDLTYYGESESLGPLSSETATGSEFGSAMTYDTLDDQRKADLSDIKDALVLYYKDMGSFPDSSDKLILLSSGNTLENALVPEYVSEFPYDPSPGNNYGYKSDGESFTLTAILDDETDPEADAGSGKAIYSVTYDPLNQTSTVSPSSSTEQTSSTSSSSLPDSSGSSSSDQEYLLDL